MNKNMKYGLLILAILIIGYFFTTMTQRGYTSNSLAIYDKDTNLVSKVLIQKGEDQLELFKIDTLWHIVGHDTLEIKESSVDNLFNKVLKIKKGTVLSINPEKYSKYSVDDSTGTHLILFNDSDQELGHFIFGSSKSDYSRNNVRVNDDINVYQTDQNVVWNLSTRPDYWGKKPTPPPIPESEKNNQ